MTAALAIAARYWQLAAIVGLAIALMVTRATLEDRTLTLRNERDAWTAEIKRAGDAKRDAEARYANNLARAAVNYAERLATIEPIVVRSTNTVREYAQTDAGRVLCRGADRVRAIDALDAELAGDPGAAGGGPAALPADAAAPPGGR